MLWNIVDRRKRGLRWKQVTAIIEPTSHDNSCDDADYADEGEALDAGASPYDELASTSVADAVKWAQEKPYAVTLFLYDLGEGIRAA